MARDYTLCVFGFLNWIVESGKEWIVAKLQS